MPGSHGTLCINSFYPETELNITKIQEYEKQILMRMKSISKDCRCPKCGYIENAVAYDYSNGFVEGTNSRLKMIKRTMYGRCRKRLLEAKLRYVGKHRNG